MDRTCYKCKETKPLETFKKSKNGPKGHSYCCKICHKKFYCHYKKYRGRDIIRKLNTVFDGIKRRCENKDGKHPTYGKIKCNLTRKEFLNWAMPNYIKFISENPTSKPSIDRISNSGDYNLDNLQIISLKENSKKRHHPDNIDDICRVVCRLSNSANISLQDIIIKLNQIIKDQ